MRDRIGQVTKFRKVGCLDGYAHPNYVIFYRVATASIEIVNVVHARREFPVSTKNE